MGSGAASPEQLKALEAEALEAGKRLAEDNEKLRGTASDQGRVRQAAAGKHESPRSTWVYAKFASSHANDAKSENYGDRRRVSAGERLQRDPCCAGGGQRIGEGKFRACRLTLENDEADRSGQRRDR